MILITVLAFNLLGDGLRDALDPKLKRWAMPLLEIQNLTVEFRRQRGHAGRRRRHARLDKGEVLGIVGEFGLRQERHHAGADGARALPRPRHRRSPAFDGQDLRTLCDGERRQLTGKDVAMIFQEPMTSLNPCFTVGFQLAETLRSTRAWTQAARRARSSSWSRSAFRRRRVVSPPSRTSSPAA